MRHRVGLGTLVVLVGAAACAAGASPELSQILPRGGQRGTEVAVTMTGNRIGDCKEVVFYRPGLSASKIASAGAGSLTATIAIAADCPWGQHLVRLRGPGGTSTLRTFWVGPFPTVEEKEPNSEFAKPQPIALNSTVHGLITGEDVDYFVVECKQGQRLSVEVEGMRLGGAFFDPAIAVLNEKRFEIAVSDDSPRLGQDAGLSVIVPADGKYVIRLRESAYGGTPTSHYRLHVGTFPQPRVAIPAGGRPGEEVEIQFIGDPLGDVSRKVRIPAGNDGATFNYHLEDSLGVSPSGIPLRILDAPNVTEVEPNDAPASATPASAPAAMHGLIGKAGDTDHFRFAAKKGQTIEFRCVARKLGSPVDAVLWVSQLDGRNLGANDDGDGRLDAVLRFTAPEDKEYVVGVRDHLTRGGPAFAYRIEATAIAPRLTTSITRYGLPPTQERQTIDVPRGNRFAILATVGRADWSGPVKLECEGVPPGVNPVSDVVPAGLGAFPIVFEASAEAPVGGSLGMIRARPAEGTTPVRSDFQQLTDLVFGRNNREYLTVGADTVAFTVTEATPFSIRIVEPKAAIVRNGTAALKVVAERRDGHKAPISLQSLYNPPGVAANTAVIPEGQTEAHLTLTANSGAGIGKWKYVVMAQSATPGGPAWVSSQLATLEVAGPPVTLAFDRLSVEQGGQATLKGRVGISAPWSGTAKVQLAGLPSKVVADPVEVTPDSKEVTIRLTADPASPVGQFKNLPAVITLTMNGEPVTYTAGVLELRIDKPLTTRSAPKKDKAAQP